MQAAREPLLSPEADRQAGEAVPDLLDRTADVFMARRSEAEAFLLKPLDAFRLRRASEALLAGGTFMEGLPSDEGSPIGAQ